MSVRVVPGVMQGDPAQARPLEQSAGLIGVPLWMDRHAQPIGDHVLATLVPVEYGEPLLIIE